MARRRQAKDAKKLEKALLKQETGPLEINGTGPAFDLLSFTLSETGERIRAFLPGPIPKAYIQIAPDEVWERVTAKDLRKASACTFAVALGHPGNVIFLNEGYWAATVKHSGENWKNSFLPVDMEITLFHEILHLFGAKHGKPMCNKVLAYINFIQKRTRFKDDDTGKYITYELDSFFKFQRIRERQYHVYTGQNPTLKEQEAFIRAGRKAWMQMVKEIEKKRREQGDL